MTVILTKALKKGNKTITGQLLQNGMTHITLAVIIKGSKSIKKFKKSDYVVTIY